jgi:hypothetical protein
MQMLNRTYASLECGSESGAWSRRWQPRRRVSQVFLHVYNFHLHPHRSPITSSAIPPLLRFSQPLWLPGAGHRMQNDAKYRAPMQPPHTTAHNTAPKDSGWSCDVERGTLIREAAMKQRRSTVLRILKHSGNSVLPRSASPMFKGRLKLKLLIYDSLR